MTFREAYEAFCTYRRGYLPDDFDGAVRVYMNTVDELIEEVSSLTVDLRRTKKKLANERRLKRKYFEQLKARKVAQSLWESEDKFWESEDKNDE